MTAPYVEIADGHRLFVRDWGKGTPVLLLAGWAMDSTLWATTMTDLNARGLRTIAYDRRGHGLSSDPGKVTFDLLADDLDAVMRALDLEGVTLVLHSAAVGEALRYITRHGLSRIARLIFVGGQGPCMIAGPDNTHGIPRAAAEAVMASMVHDMPGWLDANVEPFVPGAPRRTLDCLIGMVLGGSRRILLDYQHAIVEADFRPEAARLDLPVTIIHGDLDVSAPLDSTARRFAALIPGAELQVYEGVAHGVMVTHAARLARDIARVVAAPVEQAHAETEPA